MAEVAGELLSVNGIELYVAVAGPDDGRPVVLCHGWPELSYSWRHQLGALSDAGYRVVAPDLRGYGRSSAPTEVAAYGADRLTGDLCGLLDHYAYESAVFSGHDWGSQVVWELGRHHPERVSAIYNMSVPYAQGARPPTETFRHVFGDRFFYMLYFQRVGPVEAEFDADPRRFVRTVLYSAGAEGRAHPDPPVSNAPASGTKLLDTLTPAPDVLPAWLTEHDVDVYADGLSRNGLFGPVSYYRNLDANWQRSKDVPAARYTMPIGFLIGSLDPVNVMMPGAADEMAGVLPDFRGVTVVEGAGHWVQQERPAETNAALLSFLASVRAG